MKFFEHPLTVFGACFASVTSVLGAYNMIMTAVVVTVSAAIALNKGYKVFWPKFKHLMDKFFDDQGDIT